MTRPASHIFDFTPETLSEWCEARGMARYRAEQVLEWVYRRGVIEPAAMTNLSKGDRETLSREMAFVSGEVIGHQRASDGTQKLLVQWAEHPRHGALGGRSGDGRRGDGAGPEPPLQTDGPESRALPILHAPLEHGDPSRQTECVMIPAGSRGEPGRATARRTACISSQVGCPVGCRFCASGLGGLDGNLSAGRIVEQVWLLDQLVKGRLDRRGGDGPGSGGAGRLAIGQDPDARITNVVFMGMGEPLANFQNVLHAVRTIAADWGMGIGARRITISTVGLARAIERLGEQLEVPVTLALSLHAPNDELRRRLIPWAEYTTIEDLLRACRGWFEKTGREITLEYILLGGVNDRAEHAGQLAGVARTLRANVNLIRYNEVAGIEFARPASADVIRFQEILRERGVNVHIRASRGRDIAAACGQLRHEASRTGRRGSEVGERAAQGEP